MPSLVLGAFSWAVRRTLFNLGQSRSLARGDPKSAIEFLDYADQALDSSHLTRFLLEERADYRLAAQEALRPTSAAR